MIPDILQITPLPAGVAETLDASYAIHRWWDAPDRAALLAATGPRLRAVATDSHHGVPNPVLAAAPNLEIVASCGRAPRPRRPATPWARWCSATSRRISPGSRCPSAVA